MSAETLAADDGRWDALVDAAPTPDVYFRPGYCRAYEAAGEGRLVGVRTEGALFPLLLRDLPFGADGYDAVTPYGYGGYLPLGTGSDPVADLQRLRASCTSSGVVSVMLRLHPLVGGLGDLSALDWADVRHHGPTTAIDLARIEDGRLRGLSKGRKADLSVARRELEVSWESGDEALERFRAVYDGTMRRIGAADTYLFPREYYRELAAGLGDGLGVALALRGDEVTGGALFLADRVGRFAHYHLSGTTEVGRELKAGTLLVHEGAIWAAGRGCELLHLGGGTSGADSLYAFKRSFGGDELAYSFATLVIDPDRYEALVARRTEEPEPLRPDFFPAYRA
ncbi:MAG TPA: GNAT family N-acetyltransferase [Gaiellaceae bacterium]|nr:GNAT family N-acetyltransferase [Gaiellaceae bacterium]